MKLLKIGVIGVTLFIVWNSCKYHDLSIQPDYLDINLRWVKGYPTETKEDVMMGLTWALSFLGASIPGDSLSKAIEWKNGSHFSLRVGKVGFSPEAQAAWNSILDSLKTSEEYKLQGGIDLGRFVILTLNSTNHYYAITGAKQRYSEFRAKYNFDEKKAGIVKSSIAFGNRLIEIGIAEKFDEIAFVATEGEGALPDSFAEKEFEALDFMPNGQLRFALYDLNGNLKSSASKSLTPAGKPAKCLWCHETSLSPPFADDNRLPGFYSTEEFKAILDNRMAIVTTYRENMGPSIFRKTQNHTKAELLYLTFMEPSIERLAQEWGVSRGDAEQRVNGLPTHAHHEFSYLGSMLYNRKDVDDLGTFEPIKIPNDSRNFSEYEPDFIH